MRKIFMLLVAIMLTINIVASGDIYNGITYDLNRYGNDQYGYATVMNSWGVWTEEESHYYGDVEIPSIVPHLGYDYIVKDIGPYAFYKSAITSIVLPSTLERISYRAFAFCKQLTSITCLRAGEEYDWFSVPEFVGTTAEQMNTITDAFQGVDTSIPVYVPQKMLETYISAWGSFFTNIQPIPEQMNLDNVILNESILKLLRDGQLFILRGDKTYTVTGQEIK